MNVRKTVIGSISLVAYLTMLAMARSDPEFPSPLVVSPLSGNSSISSVDGIAVLDLKEADDYSNGVFEGKALSGSIRELVSNFKEYALVNDKYFGRPGYSYAAYRAKAYLPYIDGDAMDEMRGIADWAGIPFVDVLLINVYDDAANNLWCSSVIVPGNGSWTTFVHARNLDYPLLFLAKSKVVTRYQDRITFGFPGYVWVLTGLNSSGMTVSSHTVKSLAENKLWMPTGLLYRKVLREAWNLQDGERILSQAKRTMGNNLAMGSAYQNKGEIAEFDSESIAFKRPENAGYIASTNHFSGSGMLSANAYRTFGSSQKRLDWFDQAFGWTKSVGIPDVLEAMSHYVPDPQGAWSTVSNAGTVQSIVMLPLENRAYVAKGLIPPVTEWGYVEIRWDFSK